MVYYAEGGTRTRTTLRPGDFKSPVSAISPPRQAELRFEPEEYTANWSFAQSHR